MSGFMQQALVEATRRVPHWLQALQARGRERWQATALPTRRTETWKYTSLAALRDDYRLADPETAPLTALPAPFAAGFGGARLVFLDGVYQAGLSAANLPAGVRLCRFSDASEEQARRIAEHLDSVVDTATHPFAAHNSASLADGVFLEIDAGAELAQPVECLWLLRGAGGPVATNQRLLVLAGERSRATLIEHFAALRGAGPSFTNGITELLLGRAARLHHYRLHEEGGEAVHVGGVHAQLQRDAQLDSFHLGLGSRLKRVDVVVHHAAPGAHVNLNGVYLPSGDEHVDYHTTIEHAAPHCSSDEVFRGIIAERGRAVFNGRIHIHPQAQKTRAELSNKNLLTSADAEVNTKPELEIYADDVQCAHGATVAQLDAQSLHYLRSRGVERADAELMLSFGFINELVEEVELASLRDYLRPLIEARFARDGGLAEAAA